MCSEISFFSIQKKKKKIWKYLKPTFYESYQLKKKNYSFFNFRKYILFVQKVTATCHWSIKLFSILMPLHGIFKFRLLVFPKGLNMVFGLRLTFIMLVALCVNKVQCFIKPLYKMFTMYTISKRRQCVFLKQSKSINQTLQLQLMLCLITFYINIIYMLQQNCIQTLY